MNNVRVKSFSAMKSMREYDNGGRLQYVEHIILCYKHIILCYKHIILCYKHTTLGNKIHLGLIWLPAYFNTWGLYKYLFKMNFSKFPTVKYLRQSSLNILYIGDIIDTLKFTCFFNLLCQMQLVFHAKTIRTRMQVFITNIGVICYY